MKEREFNELLRQVILSKEFPDLNDRFADAILERIPECSPETVNRARKRFIQKLFEQIHPSPIVNVDNNHTFGFWLETTRQRANLTICDVAIVINQDEDFVERLEKNKQLPWNCNPELIAQLMQLFRISFTAVKELISTTVRVNQAGGTGLVSARSQKGKMNSSRGDSTSRALEGFLARNTKHVEPDKTIVEWLKALEGLSMQERFAILDRKE
jgi:transcriptional regulator with XRE-family HTH domain